MNHPKYRADIDGLRALAVFSVVIYHAFESELRGGFVGVDIFFVISGYLISTIIFENIEKHNFSFIEFYARRVRRIFPALICVMLGSLIFGMLALMPREFEQLGKHIAGGAGFVSNFVLWSETGYFDRAAETKPLMHLWSLGIEEQFYLLWPFAIWLAARFKKPDFLWLILCIGIASFGFNLYEAAHNPEADFYSPATRFWELMMGSALAHFTLYKRSWAMIAEKRVVAILEKRFSWIESARRDGTLWPNIKALIGISLIVIAIHYIDKRQSFPGWRALLPTIGACLLISAGTGAWVNRAVLSNRLIVWVGLISYPLYLWHWPLLSFANITMRPHPGAFVRGILVAASILLAFLTYRFVERPVRYAKKHATPKALATALLLLTIGCTGLMAERISPHVALSYGAYALAEDNYTPGLTDFIFNGRGYYIKESARKTKTFYIGDSNAIQYSPRIVKLIDDNPKETNTAVFSIGWGCPPIPGIQDDDEHSGCIGFVANSVDYIKLHPEVDTIVIVANWMGAFWSTDHTTFYYPKPDDTKDYLGPSYAGNTRATDELRKFLAELKSAGKRVYLVLNIPVGGDFNPTELIENRFAFGKYKFKEVPDSKAHFLARYESIHEEFIKAGQASGVHVIDPMQFLCDADKCISIDEDGPIHVDVEHLRASFTREHVTYMDETIKPINAN